MKRRIMARFWPDDNPLSVGDFKDRIEQNDRPNQLYRWCTGSLR